MTNHHPLPGPSTSSVPGMLIAAARCWRRARDRADPVQPSLSHTLAASDCVMLAPVIDSLCLFYEQALGRPLAVGEASDLSDDEHGLIDLVAGRRPRRCLRCSADAASTLACAACSTRIMLALTVEARGGRA